MDRYRSIIPDWSRFVRVARTPEPVTLRVRSARIEPAALARRLEARGYGLRPLTYSPGFFQVTGVPRRPVSLTLEHWAGLFYIQQAIMGLPVLALGVKPGERVLDLCAAPGGKTTHLAEALDGLGCVVASDANEKRTRVLQANVKRLGHLSVLTLGADGTEFPDGALFDRVLVDAPCSGEGNLRARQDLGSASTPSFRAYVTSLQKRLLRRAVELVRPGGVVLYSTCTFAPEENEAVVAEILEEMPVTVEPIELDVPHEPGLRSFEGERYPADLEGAWRVYPHHLDSGGLFMARLRRRGRGGDGAGWTPVPAVFGASADAREATLPDGVSEGIERFVEEFRMEPGAVAGIRWFLRGRSVWGHTAGRWPLGAWDPDGGWRFLALGLRSFKRESRGRIRPSNDLLSRLGARLGDRIVSLTRERAGELLRRRILAGSTVPRGYVALEVEGVVVGRGLVGKGGLEHQIPRARAERLARILKAS